MQVSDAEKATLGDIAKALPALRLKLFQSTKVRTMLMTIEVRDGEVEAEISARALVFDVSGQQRKHMRPAGRMVYALAGNVRHQT